MSKSIPVAISNDAANNGWKKVDVLIRAALVTAGKQSLTSIPIRCNNMQIVNDPTNAAGSKLLYTNNPTYAAPALVAATLGDKLDFRQQNNCFNGESTHDKWIKLTDGAGALISGTATIIMDIG